MLEVISEMNSNYEARKHGEYSKIGLLQKEVLEKFPEVGIENIFVSEAYMPLGQKLEPNSLEVLQETVKTIESKLAVSVKTK